VAAAGEAEAARRGEEGRVADRAHLRHSTTQRRRWVLSSQCNGRCMLYV
jgi:hypothetical protein